MNSILFFKHNRPSGTCDLSSITLEKAQNARFTIICWIWKLLRRGLWHCWSCQNPIHARGSGDIGRWAEGLRLWLWHHHRHSLLLQVMVHQLSFLLGSHLSIKESLLRDHTREPVSFTQCHSIHELSEKNPVSSVIKGIRNYQKYHYNRGFLLLPSKHNLAILDQKHLHIPKKPSGYLTI